VGSESRDLAENLPVHIGSMSPSPSLGHRTGSFRRATSGSATRSIPGCTRRSGSTSTWPSQWQNMVPTMKAAGAGARRWRRGRAPRLVFTANAGLVDGRRFVVSRFPHGAPRRAKTTPKWFTPTPTRYSKSAPTGHLIRGRRRRPALSGGALWPDTGPVGLQGHSLLAESALDQVLCELSTPASTTSIYLRP